MGLVISSILSYHILGSILLIVSIIALIIFCLFQKKKSNILIAYNRHKTKENEKHQELRKLLKNYGFDYKNESDMLSLLSLLNTKHEEYNIWGKALITGKNHFTVIALPILTFVLTKIAENADKNQMVIGGMVLIVIISSVLAFTWAIYQVFDGLMNKTYYAYGNFINDLNQVKTFSNRELK